MNHDDTSMGDDLAESAHLRRLLRAGRGAPSDYDMERGLARHLANLQSGAPLPAWAIGDEVVKVGGSSLLSWLGVPLVGAVLVGGWFALHGASAPVPVLRPAATPTPIAVIDPASASAQHSAPGLQGLPSEAIEGAADAPVEQHVGTPTHAVRSAPRNAHSAIGLNSSSAQHARAHTREPTHRHGDAANPAAEGGEFGASGMATSSSGIASAAGPSASDSATKAAAAVTPAAVTTNNPTQPQDDDNARSDEEATRAHPAADAADKTAPVIPDSRLEREMQMLAVAQRVLSEDPDRALRMARQGDREFPGSMFSAERKQLTLFALVQLGRVDEARRSGLPFLRAYPNAPWSARLRQALATGHLPTP
jgi:hypothetical protein